MANGIPIINAYNKLQATSTKNAKNFANVIGIFDKSMGTYLQGLNGATASLGGYSKQLIVAQIKTTLLQAASTALNAALTMGISLAIQGIIMGVQKLWQLIPTTEHLAERFEKTTEELAELKSKEEELNAELKSTAEKIAELESKKNLSLTDEEELKWLRQRNAELERSIELTQLGIEQKSKQGIKDFNAWASRNDVDNSFYLEQLEDKALIIQGYKQQQQSTTDKGMYSALESNIINVMAEPQKKVEEYEKQLKKLYDSGYVYGTDEDTDAYIDQMNALIDRFQVLSGKDSTLLSTIYNRSQYSEAHDAIEGLIKDNNLTADSLLQIYQAANQGEGGVKSLIDYLMDINAIDLKAVLGNNFETFDEDKDGVLSNLELFNTQTGECKISGEKLAEIMALLSEKFEKVNSGAAKATQSTRSFTEIYNSFKTSADILSGAYNDLEQNGSISVEHLSALLTEYPDLIRYIDTETGKCKITTEVLKKKFEAIKKTELAQIEASRRSIEAQKAEAKERLQSQKENAKLDMAKAISQNSKGPGKKDTPKISVSEALDMINARPGYYIRGFDWDTSAANEEIAKLDADLANFDAQHAIFSNLSLQNFTAKNPTDKNKETAEKEIAELKYRLDTNKITQEHYIKSLDGLYKKYYNDKSKYMSEYEQYSKEVYDGFKNLYKEDYNAQKAALEKQKEELKKFYDKRKEMLQQAADDEKYEEDRADKLKTVNELKILIDKLETVGTQSAKARIAELRDELAQAQKAYDDFTKDHILEEALAGIDKEYEAEEKKIQDKIDAVQKKLDSIDNNTKGVYDTIVQYARTKGITIKSAYASGTFAAVGGPNRINERGLEMIAAPDGRGNYVNMLPGSKVFSAKATKFLWDLATNRQLPQAMYSSIARSVAAKAAAPAVANLQPVHITMGDVIVQGNADKTTVQEIKNIYDGVTRRVLKDIQALQK